MRKPVEILADAESLKCTCPDTQCTWHGNCRDCVALHRAYATIPNCLELAIGQAGKTGLTVPQINDRIDD